MIPWTTQKLCAQPLYYRASHTTVHSGGILFSGKKISLTAWLVQQQEPIHEYLKVSVAHHLHVYNLVARVSRQAVFNVLHHSNAAVKCTEVWLHTDWNEITRYTFQMVSFSMVSNARFCLGPGCDFAHYGGWFSSHCLDTVKCLGTNIF